MTQAPLQKAKSISPLVLIDGFVYGWAFDPLRPTLTVTLSVDGAPPSVIGNTGFPVADHFYAVAVPPRPDTGFCLPLPAAVLDGFKHTLVVRVAEWLSTPNSLKAEEHWHFGECFGEVTLRKSHDVEGWVGFRNTLEDQTMPQVLVCDAGAPKFAITLSPAPKAHADGSQLVGRFRLDWSKVAGMTQPQFSCQGMPLRVPAAPNVQLKVLGNIEKVGYQGISGWLVNMAAPLEVLEVLLLVDGVPHSTYRPNLHGLNIANLLKLLPDELGLCAFDISLPACVKDGLEHRLELRCQADGTVLNDKPIVYTHPKPGFTLARAAQLLNLPAPARMPGPARRRNASSKSRSATPRVSVIILNRNGAPCLDGLFESFLTHNSVPVEFIVIDHHSRDNSLQIISRWQVSLPIRVVALQENRSFSTSCNAGVQLARAPNIPFLNKDIVWLQDALPPLL